MRNSVQFIDLKTQLVLSLSMHPDFSDDQIDPVSAALVSTITSNV